MLGRALGALTGRLAGWLTVGALVVLGLLVVLWQRDRRTLDRYRADQMADRVALALARDSLAVERARAARLVVDTVYVARRDVVRVTDPAAARAVARLRDSIQVLLADRPDIQALIAAALDSIDRQRRACGEALTACDILRERTATELAARAREAGTLRDQARILQDRVARAERAARHGPRWAVEGEALHDVLHDAWAARLGARARVAGPVGVVGQLQYVEGDTAGVRGLVGVRIIFR